MRAQSDATPAPPSGPCLTFDHLLVGYVVDLELARLPSPAARRHEQERQAARSLPSSERPAAIRALDRVLFQELGHEAAVARNLGARALRFGSLRLDVLLALDRADEGLLLHAARPAVHATLAILPSRFLDGTLRALLLPELERLDEAIDPEFEWRPHEARDLTVADRLASLWSAHASLMLTGRGLPAEPLEGIRDRLANMLPFTPREDVDELMQALARPDLTFPELTGMAQAQDRLAAVETLAHR